ncbi:MAG: CAP domain-containing protein [Actinomycetota bacterium]
MRLFCAAPVPRVQMAVAFAVVAVMTLAVLPASPRTDLTESEPVSGYSFTKAERCFLKKINALRERRGKRLLRWDKQLGYVARRHARGMASNRSIYHDGDLGRTVTRWRRLGQNVGRGSGCRRLMRAFKNSSGHRANLLGRWRHMGVGVKRRGGNVFVMHVFESRRNPGNVYRYP